MINLHHATPAHNQQLLQLLEENAMQGWANMVMTRRPNYFAKQHYFGKEYPVLAEENGDSLGMYQLTKHQGFINGQLTELGYLNSLRVHNHYRNKIRVLKAGFAHLKTSQEPPQYCYTSIASDNKIARRLLEKGLTGLPQYRLLGELSSLAICTQRGKVLNLWQNVAIEDYPALVEFYNQHARTKQLSPFLELEWLKKANLPVLGYYKDGVLQACAVLWNQQSFKQVMATRYHPFIRLLKPWYNGYARLAKKVTLPKLNEPLNQSFLAFFALRNPQDIIPLLYDGLSKCQTAILTLAMATQHPQLREIIQRFKPLTYQTCIYAVDLIASPSWDKKLLQPEAAIL